MPVSTNPIRAKNLDLTQRWASILGGATLVAYGVKKRSAAGTLTALLGSDLVYRGMIGRPPLFQLGRRTMEQLRPRAASIPYRQGIRVDAAITIDKPVEELYSFWRNLENLPRFMQHLHRVTRIDDKRSHWVSTGPGGKTVEWDAEINNEIPNELIGWRSIEGSQVDTAGSVHFKAAPGGRGTEVLVEFQYNPPGGLLGAAYSKLMGQDPSSQVKNDLYRLKQMIETGEVATIEGQPSGKQEMRRRRPARAYRSGSRDQVMEASEQSFPASDPPSWTSSRKERVS